MDTQKVVFWLITTIAGIGVTIIILAVKLFITAINEKINNLFLKFDDLLEKIGQLVNDSDFKELEKKVNDMQRTMDKCPSCNKVI